MMSAALDHSIAWEPPLLGDHLAMDLLNTEARIAGAPADFFTSAEAVLGWLARQGIVPAPGSTVDGAALLAQAIALRALVRQLVFERKQGRHADIGALNTYLHAFLSAPELQHDGDGNLTLGRAVRAEPVAALLGPVAEAAAQLLVEDHFNLVKQCEHPDCILWFYDRTKAHKRRWCSMALCGNRFKAAQFRKRSGGETA